jgi:DHA1 family bicyclomycin/chloramphenicol resistance-like MFS transporter
MRKIKSTGYVIFVTGILVGFPALITDMYLPAFPALAEFFNTGASFIQTSLMSTMIGIALGQLIIGPLSDKHGRVAPLMVSLAIFIIATLFCIYTQNITAFIILRLAQGLACSSGMVLSRAILTDIFTGRELAKSLSINTAVLGVTPTLAPVIGGLLLTFSQWQGVFVFLLVFGFFLLLLGLSLEETLPKAKRKTGSSLAALKNIAAVIKNKKYIAYVLIFAFAMALMFAYISSSPFIFQEHYGLSPLAYGIIFGANALAQAAGALIAGYFKSQEKAVKTGIYGLFIMSLVTAAALLSGIPFICFEASIFIMFVFGGITYPSSTMLALESNRKNAGTAASIHGSMSFLAGGIISPLVGLGNILVSTSIAIIVCALITVLALAYLNSRRAESVAENITEEAA